MEEGPKYIHEDQNDLQTQSLRQQMDEVQNGWQQLQVLWDTRKALLEQSMNHQVNVKTTLKRSRSLSASIIKRI